MEGSEVKKEAGAESVANADGSPLIDYSESFSLHFSIDRNGLARVSTDVGPRHKSKSMKLGLPNTLILRRIYHMILNYTSTDAID